VKTLLSAVLVSVSISANAQSPAARTTPAAKPAAVVKIPPPAPRVNPFLNMSALPYQLPPFDKIKDEDFVPAFEAGMAEQLKEMAAIAKNSEAPTFDNTIVAMERTGRLLTRVSKTFFNLNASNTDDAMQKIEADMAPKLAAHQDAINLDGALFARVQALYAKRDALNLDAESAQLLSRYYLQFVRAGAKLSEADKARLKAMNQELSTMTTQFGQNLLKNAKNGAVIVDDAKQLKGLSTEQIGAAAEAAKARGLEGKWVLSLQNTTIQPILETMEDRALREKVFKASVARGVGGETDNASLAAKIAALRAQWAALLGYRDYASYALEDEGAKTPEAVNKMLSQLGRAALLKAKAEAAEIQALIDVQAKASHSSSFKLEPWDWAFYAAQVRKAKYSFDEAQVKPYFELDRVLKDGVFYAAHELYGVTFKERADLPVYRNDVRVFEVFEANGSPLGLILFDYFKRDNKNGGAWMDAFVDQSGLFGTKPLVINNLNINKPAPGQPVLLTFDEVSTMFHEFGHGVHGLFSDAKYPTLAGTSVPADFVEYPSQFNEMWAREPQVLANFAKNYKTGEPLPKALFEKILAAQTYGEGYASTEYLEAAMIDQTWHQFSPAKAPAPETAQAFELAALKKAGMQFAPVPPRYHTPYFAHAFSGGYAAGYYAYIWSEVLARDTGAWFHTHGGMSRANGDFFRAKVLSRGRTLEPGTLFEQFYGGAPTVEPLLEYRGLKN
jgi:peptidyl-dipeptidase Dcp